GCDARILARARRDTRMAIAGRPARAAHCRHAGRNGATSMKSLLGPLSGAAFVLFAALTPALAQPQPACSGVVAGDPNFFQQTVFFAVGSSALTAESRATIQRAAEQIRAQFRDRVCLIGRT